MAPVLWLVKFTTCGVQPGFGFMVNATVGRPVTMMGPTVAVLGGGQELEEVRVMV
ncbi:MAG: hypothetical protein U0176_07490 [Bacteroidia bacterium]